MDPYDVIAFSLKSKEKAECKALNIPEYFWYFKKAKERKLSLSEFIGQRITGIFSSAEREKLKVGITNKVKELVRLYYDGQRQKIENLDREFKYAKFLLFDKIVYDRKQEPKKKNKKLKSDKTFSFVSRYDNTTLNLTLTFKGKAKVDKYCLYFKECYHQTTKYKGRLDCSACKLHQSISVSYGED